MTTFHPVMYVPGMDACVNRWFTSYNDAEESLKVEGGYLFSYKNQRHIEKILS